MLQQKKNDKKMNLFFDPHLPKPRLESSEIYSPYFPYVPPKEQESWQDEVLQHRPLEHQAISASQAHTPAQKVNIESE